MSQIKTERILDHPSICIDHAGEGEMLILMHGIGGNRTNWAEQVEAFRNIFTRSPGMRGVMVPVTIMRGR